jgi:hypothetical protein
MRSWLLTHGCFVGSVSPPPRPAQQNPNPPQALPEGMLKTQQNFVAKTLPTESSNVLSRLAVCPCSHWRARGTAAGRQAWLVAGGSQAALLVC